MKFMEVLPEGCPPNTAVEEAIEGAYRVVSSSSPTVDDFKSHAALGIPKRPTSSECHWRSCSLFLSRDKALDLAGKLPKSRATDPHLATLCIAEGRGKATINAKTSHIHFWMSQDFDFETAIVLLEKVPI